MAATIVIVDDEPDILDLLKLILTEKTGHKILTTTNPHQALEWCKTQNADLLISDLRMPEMEGIELLKLIQQYDPNLPFVLITAFGTIESAVESMRYKAFDYLAKPFRKEQILVTVDKALKWRQAQIGG